MSKYFKAEDVIRAIEEMQNGYNGWSDTYDKAQIIGVLEELPTIEVSEDCISREWAINKQKELIELYTPHKTVEGRGQVYWQIEERKLVAKELEQAPSVVPLCEECGNCEFRDEDFDEALQSVAYEHGYEDGWNSNSRAEGEWYRQTTDHFDYWECSECGMGVGLDDIKNFCPNCGAKMKEVYDA